jgi:hypothetical protein
MTKEKNRFGKIDTLSLTKTLGGDFFSLTVPSIIPAFCNAPFHICRQCLKLFFVALTTSVCLSVCMYVCLLSFPSSPFLFPNLSLCMSSLSLPLPLSFLVCLSFYPSVLLSYCPSALLSFCSTVLLSYCPSVLLSICPTVLLSNCPSVLLSL